MSSYRVNLSYGASIQYVGLSGCTHDCIAAIERILIYHNNIERISLFTLEGHHCLCIHLPGEDMVFVRDGFGSGYIGGGSSGLSYILSLFESRKIEIDEFEITANLFCNIVNARLDEKDVNTIGSLKPVRPRRWYDYIFDRHEEQSDSGKLWQNLGHYIPLSIIDSRIVDLALTFWEAPSDRLSKGYRRLEDIVRDKTGLLEDSSNLFSKSFLDKESALVWQGLRPGEQKGRAQLFIGLFMAHRNPRSHRELENMESFGEALSEFMLLNHLYRLESESTLRAK